MANVVALVTGNGVAQAINAAGTLGLAWLIAPDAFGLFALFIAAVSFLAVLGGGRYELGIMLPDDDEEAANVLTLSAIVLLGIASVFVIIVAVFYESLSRLLGVGHWLWSMPLALLVTGFYHVLSQWSGRMKRFRDVARSRVYQALGILTAQLTLLLAYESGGLALIGGWIFGQFVGVLFLLVRILRSEGAFLARAHDWSVVRGSVNKYRNFPLYKAPYSFVSNASAQCVPMVLQFFADLTVLGFYSIANRAVYLPVTLIASSMNQVFYEKVATELRYGRLETFVIRILRIQVVLATPVLVLMTFDARMLVTFLLGAKWSGAGIYVTMLAWVAYLSFLTSWLDRFFDVRGRQKLSLVLAIAGSATSLAGLFLTLWVTRNTALAVGVYSALQVLYIMTWLCMAFRVAEFQLRTLLILVKDAVFSAAIAVTIIGLLHMAFDPWLAVLLSIGAVLIMDVAYFFRYVLGGRAFTSTAERFRHLWNKRIGQKPKSPDDRLRVDEVQMLLSAHPHARMLEIGCGKGTLFSSLERPVSKYKGVDFCKHYINEFQEQHPEAKLECAEGACYVERDSLYDVILLNGMAQHCDSAMLRSHLKNACVMMHDESRLIWTSVPNRAYRRLYDLGVWSGRNTPSVVRLWKTWLHRALGLDLMGYWYDPEAISRLAAEVGLECTFIRSTVSSYRFHVVMESNKRQTRCAPIASSTSIFPPIEKPRRQRQLVFFSSLRS